MLGNVLSMRLLPFFRSNIMGLRLGFPNALLASFIIFAATLSFAESVSYRLSFDAGWTLAGNSINSPIDVQAMFGGQLEVRSVWKWDASGSKWAFYAPSLDATGALANYAATNGYTVLTTINPGEGFWVNATAPISLGTQNGTGYSLARANLAVGWNLSATADNVSAATLTNNLSTVASLWAWDSANGTWYFYSPSLAANNTLASYLVSRGYKDFGQLSMGNGLGFWVRYVGGQSTDSTLMGGAVQGRPLSPYTSIVTTIAGTAKSTGSTDATGAAARFQYPLGITTDGTNLYVADYTACTIRKIVIATDAVTTIAGSPYSCGSIDATGAAARFQSPTGITTDGTNLYVADGTTIRKIIISTAVVTTIAGSGAFSGSTDATGTAARFAYVPGITTDGTNLYAADSGNSTIRKIAISSGAVTTLAGAAGSPGEVDGIGSAARFQSPSGITTDGTNLYVADFASTVRKIVISTGAVTTLAGTASSSGSIDATGAAARFQSPSAITTDGANLYVADINDSTIRKVAISTAVVTTIAGTPGGFGSTDGTGAVAKFEGSWGITTDGTNLYVADNGNSTIRKISAITTAPTTAPTNVTASIGSTQTSFTWTAVSGATSYTIYCAVGTSVTANPSTKIATVVASQYQLGDIVQYAYPGLTGGTTYTCIVLADNNFGEGPASNPISPALPTCSNGATNYPTCTLPTCSNGATNYPTCTLPTCSNGATNYPTCTLPSCSNGATNYPTCTLLATGNYYANWACNGSAGCIANLGGNNGTSGPFCDLNSCNAWSTGSIYMPGICSTTPSYAPSPGGSHCYTCSSNGSGQGIAATCN